MAQQVKNLALLLLWLWLQLWYGFHLWPGNFRMLWVRPKKISMDYTSFQVIMKYWLYSLCNEVCPCSLFILYLVVYTSPTSILPLPTVSLHG